MVIELTSLFIGTLCLFFGYKLLMRGVYSDTDAAAVWSNHALLIKRSVPGVLFALFGAAMVVAGVLHSSELRGREAPSAKAEQTEGTKQSSAVPQHRRKHVRDEENKQRVAPAQASTTAPAQSSSEQVDPPSPAKSWKPGRT